MGQPRKRLERLHVWPSTLRQITSEKNLIVRAFGHAERRIFMDTEILISGHATFKMRVNNVRHYGTLQEALDEEDQSRIAQGGRFALWYNIRQTIPLEHEEEFGIVVFELDPLRTR